MPTSIASVEKEKICHRCIHSLSLIMTIVATLVAAFGIESYYVIQHQNKSGGMPLDKSIPLFWLILIVGSAIYDVIYAFNSYYSLVYHAKPYTKKSTDHPENSRLEESGKPEEKNTAQTQNKVTYQDLADFAMTQYYWKNFPQPFTYRLRFVLYAVLCLFAMCCNSFRFMAWRNAMILDGKAIPLHPDWFLGFGWTMTYITMCRVIGAIRSFPKFATDIKNISDDVSVPIDEKHHKMLKESFKNLRLYGIFLCLALPGFIISSLPLAAELIEAIVCWTTICFAIAVIKIF
ncbi:MAG: hypothetical protein ABW189_09360 [Rickettsiales bacterium]